MARRVYFAFDYQDVLDFRANVVRNSSKFRGREIFFKDASIWEAAKLKNKGPLKELLNKGILRSSVTCVLIGSKTYTRPWVRYEIVKSFAEGKGLLGIHINWIKDKYGNIKFLPGSNPFDQIKVDINSANNTLKFYERTGNILNPWRTFKDLKNAENKIFKPPLKNKSIILSDIVDVYSYKFDNGKKNISEWIEAAALNRRKSL